MRNLKYIIIALVILILIITATLIILTSKKEKKDEIAGINIPQDTIVEFDKKTVKEENDNVFFTISNIIQNNINKENTYYYAQEMYKIQNDKYASYYTYGLIKNENIEKLEDYYLKVDIDYINNTFLLEAISKEDYGSAKKGEISKINEQRIAKKNNNSYEIENYTSKGIASKYIMDFIIKAQYQTNNAFELLENNYKDKKFENIEQFKEYIQKNKERLTNFEIKNCECEVMQNSLEYTVIDQSDNYYKIIIYNALNYKIILEKDI